MNACCGNTLKRCALRAPPSDGPAGPNLAPHGCAAVARAVTLMSSVPAVRQRHQRSSPFHLTCHSAHVGRTAHRAGGSAVGDTARWSFRRQLPDRTVHNDPSLRVPMAGPTDSVRAIAVFSGVVRRSSSSSVVAGRARGPNRSKTAAGHARGSSARGKGDRIIFRCGKGPGLGQLVRSRQPGGMGPGRVRGATSVIAGSSSRSWRSAKRAGSAKPSNHEP
jgi:hypothetical protein